MSTRSSMPHVPHLTLNNGVEIPQLGFGVWKIPAGETERAVGTALEVGYRSIDTAALYGNEAEVAAAVRASGLPRDDVFLTSKVWNTDHGYDETLAAFDASMQRFGAGIDYLDLYLIHWPLPKLDRYVETWRALEHLLDAKRVRAIGVSNFEPAHLARLMAETTVVPALNQVELHPDLAQAAVRTFDAEHGIVTEAWAPLARGGALLEDSVVVSIAEKHDRTSAQVVIRWHLQIGNVVIPKSVTPSRIAANFEVFDFALDDDDLAAFATLDVGNRTGNHPDTMED